MYVIIRNLLIKLLLKQVLIYIQFTVRKSTCRLIFNQCYCHFSKNVFLPVQGWDSQNLQGYISTSLGQGQLESPEIYFYQCGAEIVRISRDISLPVQAWDSQNLQEYISSSVGLGQLESLGIYLQQCRAGIARISRDISLAVQGWDS